MNTEVKQSLNLQETCPINLDKIHCQSCFFNQDGCQAENLPKQSICCRCGQETYSEFKQTGHAHVCPDMRKVKV